MSSNCIRLVKRYLCVKKLTIHDGFTAKSVKLPRAEARFFMGELRNRQATPVVLLDEDGSCWELLCTCIGGQYALSRIGAFCEAHGATPGCYFIFYADHDHIVRLAVRQELPEDVQAALAAARAAIAARTSPQQPVQPLEQQRKPDVPVVSDIPSQPVMDDPVALDEIVSSAGAKDPADVHKAATTPVEQAQGTGSGSPRAMPLQDRSNLPPVGATAAEAAGGGGGKARPLGEKPIGQQAATGIQAAAQPAVKDADKENDAGAAVRGPADKVQAAPPSWPVTSTGGLSLPTVSFNPATNKAALKPSSPQPQNPPQPQGQISASSASASPQPARVAIPQLPPSPATRLRLRFEARLRAQVGKLHPLSVRTGPEAAPPTPPGYRSSAGFTWPSSVPGSRPLMQPPGAMWSGVSPTSWGHAGCQGHAAEAYGDDSSDADDEECGTSYETETTRSGAVSAQGGTRFYRNDGHYRQQQGFDAANDATTMAEGRAASGDSWRQQLQCDELLDWEIGRRTAAGGQGAALDHFCTVSMPPPQPHRQQAVPWQQQASPSPPPPCWLPHRVGEMQAADLALLRQLLTRQQSPSPLQPAPPPAAASAGPCGMGSSTHQVERDSRAQPPLWSGRQTQGGVLLSMAAANSTLRQLLGLRPPATGVEMAAAWDLVEGMARARTMSGPHDGSQGSAQQGCGLYVCRAQQRPQGPVSELGFRTNECQGGADCGAEPLGARTKSGLAVGRAAAGPPADLRCSKRHCPEPSVAGSNPEPSACCRVTSCLAGPAAALPMGTAQAASERAPSAGPVPGLPLASKVLTAQDLLTDRVLLSVDAAAYARATASSTEGAGVEPMDVDCPAGVRGDCTAGSVPSARAVPNGTSKQQQPSQQCPNCLTKRPVDVVVESGAQYEGMLTSTGSMGLDGVAGGPVQEYELQGLRPYLIRRQAGVGDVLTFWVDESDPLGHCLRLRTHLQQQAHV